MKIATLIAAGAALLVGTVPAAIAPASAQRTVVHERTTVVRHGPDRRWRTRRVCDWRGHGHHRTRVCRTVRYR